MYFTIEEIKTYLEKCRDLSAAIKGLSEQAIVQSLVNSEKMIEQKKEEILDRRDRYLTKNEGQALWAALNDCTQRVQKGK